MFQPRTATEAGDAGYTLLELLVVIAIISLVLIGLPQAYGSLVPAYRARQFAYDIADLVREIRTEARQKRKILTLTYQAQDPAHMEVLQGDATNLGKILYAPHNVTVSYSQSLPWGAPGDTSVLFYPNGSSSGGTFTVHGGKVAVRVTVEWLSGVAKVEQ